MPKKPCFAAVGLRSFPASGLQSGACSSNRAIPMGKECLVVGVQPAITATPGTSQFEPLDKQAGKFENRLLGPTKKFSPSFQRHASKPFSAFEPICGRGTHLHRITSGLLVIRPQWRQASFSGSRPGISIRCAGSFARNSFAVVTSGRSGSAFFQSVRNC
jgi:hypothetical protein